MRDSLLRVSFGSQAADIDLRGSTRPELVLGHDRKLWVHKPASAIKKLGVFAEILAALLGAELGAPIPAIAIEKLRRGFLSEYREGAFHWDAAFRDSVRNMEEFGAALVLDAVIGNGDRHSKNFILQPTSSAAEPEYNIACIDHERCWLSAPEVLAALQQQGNALRPPSCRSLPRSLPMAELRPLALAAVSHAIISDAKVAMLALEAGEAAGVGDDIVSVVGDVLSMRCRNARTIVEYYLTALEEHCA